MKIVIVAVLVTHGLIHAMGFAGTLGLARFPGVSQTPTHLVSAQPGDSIVRLLALTWLLGLILFLVTATLLVVDNPAWRMTALGGVVLSMGLIVLWWANAPMGAVANALVLAAVVFAPRMSGVPA